MSDNLLTAFNPGWGHESDAEQYYTKKKTLHIATVSIFIEMTFSVGHITVIGTWARIS